MLERFPDGARVCFIGDSLTAQNTVQWMTVDCYKQNFPNANVEFFNCGVAGGTAASALLYLEDDVLIHNPTHALIGFGVNDSARDVLSLPRTAERYDRLVTAFENYKVNMRKLCDELITRGIKVTICTPPPYDEYHESATPALVGGYALMLAYAEEARKVANSSRLPGFCKEQGTVALPSNTSTHQRNSRRGVLHISFALPNRESFACCLRRGIGQAPGSAAQPEKREWPPGTSAPEIPYRKPRRKTPKDCLLPDREPAALAPSNFPWWRSLPSNHLPKQGEQPCLKVFQAPARGCPLPEFWQGEKEE